MQPYRLTSGASLPPRLIAWLRIRCIDCFVVVEKVGKSRMEIIWLYRRGKVDVEEHSRASSLSDKSLQLDPTHVDRTQRLGISEASV
jgi:hypothetical protein